MIKLLEYLKDRFDLRLLGRSHRELAKLNRTYSPIADWFEYVDKYDPKYYDTFLQVKNEIENMNIKYRIVERDSYLMFLDYFLSYIKEIQNRNTITKNKNGEPY
jgi:hypothetical protein